jgi:hypothetical protein
MLRRVKRERRPLGVVVGFLVAIGLLGWFLTALGKDFPPDRVSEWCDHAQALDDAKMRDRAYVAYRSLHKAGNACDAQAELADLRFWMARREQLLEGARAFRRAADLRGRTGQEAGRRDALRDAFSAYQDALEIDPFARGARQGFVRLVATYRRIDPEAPDCARSRGVAGAGLLPEARLYLSRALRSGNGDICRVGLEWLAGRRAAAYQHLRVAQAREHAGDVKGARAAYAATLREDSSQRQAIAGLHRAEPPPLVEEGSWASDAVGFFGMVVDVVPRAMLAFIASLSVVLVVWPAVRRRIERHWLLKRAIETRVQTEGTADLPNAVAGIVDDTLARLHTPWIDPSTGKVQSSVATPKGAQAEVDGLFTAVEPVALAAQVLRRAASLLRTTSDVALVLEKATGEGELEQRWRVIDRRTRRTLARMQFHERDLSFRPKDPDKRLEFFIIRAAEELRAAIVKAEAIRATSLEPEFTR